MNLQDLEQLQKAEKIKVIRTWALEHYSEGGDWIIETHTDEEIDHEFENLGDAIRYCKWMKGREEDFRNA